MKCQNGDGATTILVPHNGVVSAHHLSRSCASDTLKLVYIFFLKYIYVVTEPFQVPKMEVLT